MANENSHITVSELFRDHGEELQLHWSAGLNGGDKSINPEEYRSHGLEPLEGDVDEAAADPHRPATIAVGKSLVGYLNLIHPHQIQVLGSVEMDYLEALRDLTRQDTIKQLISQGPACLVIAEGRKLSQELKERCDEFNVPLFTSPQNSTRLSESIRYYLTSLFAEARILHGVFLEVMSIGVLLTGPSGIGKSEVALELIARGHSRLVADDAPSFTRIAPDIIRGSCPEILRDFLEVRGLGIINVRKLYGDNSIRSNKFLRLIIQLVYMNEGQLQDLDRMEGSYQSRSILGLEIPQITLPVAPGRNLAVMLECAVRNHILRADGYNAAQDFAEKQQLKIEQRNG